MHDNIEISGKEHFEEHFEKYFKNLEQIKHLFFAENPLSLYTYFYYTGPSNKRSAYFTAVYDGVVENKPPIKATKEEQLKDLLEHGVLVWDIFQYRVVHKNCKICEHIVPGEPIDSNLRTKMIEGNCSVAAFESSVKSLCKKIAETKNIALSDELKIYFMMPQLTSLPIFNYFNNPDKEEEKKKEKMKKQAEMDDDGTPMDIVLNPLGEKEEKTINEIVYQRIGKPNPVVINSEEYNKEIFPRHMLNVIGGSNTPRANLIKYARENQF